LINNSFKLYLINDGIKHYITDIDLVKKHGLSWSMLKTVDTNWLNSLPSGDKINN